MMPLKRIHVGLIGSILFTITYNRYTIKAAFIPVSRCYCYILHMFKIYLPLLPARTYLSITLFSPELNFAASNVRVRKKNPRFFLSNVITRGRICIKSRLFKFWPDNLKSGNFRKVAGSALLLSVCLPSHFERLDVSTTIMYWVNNSESSVELLF